jgi:hypothetical protein
MAFRGLKALSDNLEIIARPSVVDSWVGNRSLRQAPDLPHFISQFNKIWWIRAGGPFFGFCLRGVAPSAAFDGWERRRGFDYKVLCDWLEADSLLSQQFRAKRGGKPFLEFHGTPLSTVIPSRAIGGFLSLLNGRK